MAYAPGPVPPLLAHMGAYIRQELEKLKLELSPQPQHQFKVAHAEPPKPRQGMLAYADGTDWDPGSGEGLYRHDGSAWVFIG
jgi:hypothetical protein